MKKFLTILFLLVFITSCSVSNKNIDSNTPNFEVKKDFYTVGGRDINSINIYGNVLNNNTKTIVAHNNGKLNSLSCELGKKVNYDTFIAEISPDTASLSYKSNVIQISSLNEQLANVQSIKSSTLQNFDTQLKQLELQEENLKTKFSTNENNLSILKDQKGISSDDISVKIESIENQIKNLEESKELVLKNKEKNLKDISESIENLKGQIYNTGNKSIQRLDEIFGISYNNKDKNDNYDQFLGAQNSTLKSSVKSQTVFYVENINGNLKGYSDEELSAGIKKLSETLKDGAIVIKDSTSSLGALSQAQIDGWYGEFLAYSDGLLTYKMNFDKLKNALITTSLGFDTKIKELDTKLDSLKDSKKSLENNTTKSTNLTYDSNINNLTDALSSIETSLKNIIEQKKSLKDNKNTTIKQLDSQITRLQDSISKTNVLLSSERLTAGVKGTIKKSLASEGNLISAGSPICMIVPDKDSLKLEIYSPENLDLGLDFKYLKNGQVMGTGTIVSESPDINSKTQNYTYEGEIDFGNLKSGDYLDIKVIKKASKSEIWIPIHYVFPKLDGYYVNLKKGNEISVKKVKTGKMNNGEIRIITGLENGDTLAQ